MKNTLYLMAENKLGTLERIISTFTMRGYQIENLVYVKSKNPNLVDLKITLKCSDQELEKLVKLLHSQIHVLEIRLIMDEKEKDRAYVALAS